MAIMGLARDVAPAGFDVLAQQTEVSGCELVLSVRSRSVSAACPSCGSFSAAVHSHYRRTMLDLPVSGRRLRLIVDARRFRCRTPGCPRQVFCERLPSSVAWARRTARLDDLVRHLALALGGRPAARMATRLMAPVSNDTLLRVVRRSAPLQAEPAKVVGVDDWALRKNHHYGTIVCDLERRRPLRLLPDREPATVAVWFEMNPKIAVIARDRAGSYALAATRGAPQAVQVADRWHLMENASAAFLDAVRGAMREVRFAIGACEVDPALLTAAERLQYEGWRRREAMREAIIGMAADGVAIKEIVRRTGHSRALVRASVRGRPAEIFRPRQNALEPWLVWLDARWSEGRRNGAALWRELKDRGFRGSLRVVTEWATRRRQAEKAEKPTRAPAARPLARLMTTGRDKLTKAETVTIAAIEAGVPTLVTTRDQVEAFHEMVRMRAADRLDGWIATAAGSLIGAFANGLAKDIDAVRAALTEPWSNGQTEGQINKLKLIKRQMYGRGKLDLLEARLIGAN